VTVALWLGGLLGLAAADRLGASEGVVAAVNVGHPVVLAVRLATAVKLGAAVSLDSAERDTLAEAEKDGSALVVGAALGLTALLVEGTGVSLPFELMDGDPLELDDGDGQPVALGLADALTDGLELHEAQDADGDGLAELLVEGLAD
jgi:hypothetical protein